MSQLNSEVVTGVLVKLVPEQAEEVGDLDAHELASVTVPNAAVAKSRFFLDMPTGLIAFQYVSGQISTDRFRAQFCAILEQGLGKFFVTAEIELIQQRFEFLEELKRFTRLERLEIKLHPTNPHNAEWYRRTDERLKELEAAKYREVYEADQRGLGLNVVGDEDIRGKVLMAEDGYGVASASGVLDGDAVSISTRENPVSAPVHLGNLAIGDVFEILSEVFNELKRRFS